MVLSNPWQRACSLRFRPTMTPQGPHTSFLRAEAVEYSFRILAGVGLDPAGGRATLGRWLSGIAFQVAVETVVSVFMIGFR
jgi:hypothetical protein